MHIRVHPDRDPAAAIEQVVALLLRLGIYQPPEMVAALGAVMVRTFARTVPPDGWAAGVDVMIQCLRDHVAALEAAPDLVAAAPEGSA